MSDLNSRFDAMISYSERDKNWAILLKEELSNKGINAFAACKDLKSEDIVQTVQKTIETSVATIVIWTDNSVASNWVMLESAIAYNKAKLIQVHLDETVSPDAFRKNLSLKLADSSSGTCSVDTIEKIFQQILANKHHRKCRRIFTVLVAVFCLVLYSYVCNALGSRSCFSPPFGIIYDVPDSWVLSSKESNDNIRRSGEQKLAIIRTSQTTATYVLQPTVGRNAMKPEFQDLNADKKREFQLNVGDHRSWD